MLRTLWTGVSVTLVLWCAAPALAELRDDVAKQFNAEPIYFVLNLPPRPGGWPGSVYTPDMRFMVVAGQDDDPALARGPIFDMTAEITLDLSASVSAKMAGLFGLKAGASDIAAATVTFRQSRIFDLTLAQARAKLLSVSEPQKKPPGPVIVYRSYQGLPTLTIRRRAGASAEGWAELKKGVIDAGIKASATAGDAVVLQTSQPVIFAFEVARATDLERFASSTPTRVTTQRISPEEFRTLSDAAANMTGLDRTKLNGAISKIGSMDASSTLATIRDLKQLGVSVDDSRKPVRDEERAAYIRVIQFALEHLDTNRATVHDLLSSPVSLGQTAPGVPVTASLGIEKVTADSFEKAVESGP